MNKITNEQLERLIKSAVNSSGPLPTEDKFAHIISALRELRYLRYSLANREAQPVGFRYRHKDTASWLYNDWRRPDSVEAEQCQIEWLYTAPPAPAVPEKMTAVVRGEAEFVAGWNACRAAMLAQPVSQGYKLPDGWIACSERMPDDGVVVLCHEGGGVSTLFHRGNGVWDDGDFHSNITGVTHWMPLPAVPEGGK